MTFTTWVEYVILNFTAACAIALDACLLVILKFKDFSKPTDVMKWGGAVGLTHVIFPMVGFVGGWIIIERYHLATLIYSLGALLLGVLIFHVIREATESHLEIETPATPKTNSKPPLLMFWVPVLSVSLDALLSGPGKTVLIDRYPKDLAILSFLLVGSLVGIFTLFAGLVSRQLHNRWIANRLMSASSLAKAITVGIAGEIILFSLFLVWCVADFLIYLPETVRFEIPFLYVLVGGFITGGALSIVFFKRIWAAQFAKASALLSEPSQVL